MAVVKVKMKPAASAGELIENINRCEAGLRKSNRSMQWIFFEPDNKERYFGCRGSCGIRVLCYRNFFLKKAGGSEPKRNFSAYICSAIEFKINTKSPAPVFLHRAGLFSTRHAACAHIH